MAIPGHFGVTGPLALHDLRRARTPADPIRPRHTGTGADRAHLAPRRRAERNGRGRRLRVRLDGSGRRRDHGGGRRGRRGGGRDGRRGGRRRRRHRPVPGPDADPALPADTHADPSGARTPSPAEADTEARTDAEADATASTHPRAGTRATASTPTAPAPAETEAPTATAGSGRGGETRARAHADTERASRAAAGPGQLSGVPRPGAQAPAPRWSVAGLVHPAHHSARGARRRRAAPALTPGGTLCRIGLFWPSR